MNKVFVNEALGEFSFKKEVLRKLFHVTMLIFPLSYIPLEKGQYLQFIVPFCIFFVLCDAVRVKYQSFGFLLNKAFGFLLRSHEKSSISGASYFLIGFCFCAICFSKQVAIFGVFILAICDSAASLVGKSFGKIKIPPLQKSFEGFVAFIVFGILTILLLKKYLYTSEVSWIDFVAIAVTAFVELISKKLKIDDNLSVQITYCGLYSILGVI